jgi:hypothetical protein
MKHIYTFLFLTVFCSVGFSQYHFNRAAHFTDSSYYESVDESNFDFTGAITLEAWIKPDSIPTYAGIIGKNYTTGYYFGLTSGGQLRFGRAGDLVDGTAIIPINEWTHVAVTYDGISTVNFYVNGQADAVSSGTTAGAIPNVADPFRIGCDQESGFPDYFFYGFIDEVRIWDAVLPGGQINSHQHIPMGVDYGTGTIYAGAEESFRMNLSDPTDSIRSDTYPYNKLAPHNITSINYSNKTSDYLDYNSHLVFDGNAEFRINYNVLPSDLMVGKSMTAEVWVRMDTTIAPPGSYMNIFNQSGGSTEYPFGIYTSSSTGTVYFEINSGFNFSVNGGNIRDMQWHHIAGTYSDISGHMELFVDGALVDSSTFNTSSDSIPQSTYNYYLGSIGASSFSTNRLVGGVDEARIWRNVIRTPAQIKKYMYEGIDGSVNDPQIDSLIVFGLDGITRESNFDISIQTPKFYGNFQGTSSPVFASSKMNQNSNPTSPLLRLDGVNYPTDFRVSRVGLPIPDLSVVTDTIQVTGLSPLVDLNAVEVLLLANHTFSGDLSVWLFNAVGDSVQLVSSNGSGCNGNDIMTIFSLNADSTYSNDCSVDNMVPSSPSVKPENPFNPLFTANPLGGWRLKIFDDFGGLTGFWHAWGLRISGFYIGVDEVAAKTFTTYNFPNPFKENTTIYFELLEIADVKLNIYDQSGRIMMQQVIQDAVQGANYYQINLGSLASGIYFYELTSGEYKVVHKMIVQ